MSCICQHQPDPRHTELLAQIKIFSIHCSSNFSVCQNLKATNNIK